MEKNLGEGVSFDYDAEGYDFDKVVFQKGLPPLDSELNLSQELQEILIRRSSTNFSSGWFSFKDYFTSDETELQNSFYTQDPNGAIPEIALVNGWPVFVSGTNTTLKNVNKILLTEFPLLSGSRVDGVFLEVWRSLISPTEGSKPVSQSIINDINGIFMISENLGWAVGNNGVILKTDNGGITWISQNSITGFNIKKVEFITESLGFAIGDHGLILKTTNGGDLWRQLSIDSVDNLSDITSFDANKLWVCGDNGTILKTNDGENFDVVLNTKQVTQNINGIFFFDNLVGWSVGDDGVLIKTNDGGVSWNLVPISNISSRLNSIYFVNLNDGLLVGDNGLILKSTDGGNNWANISESIFNEDTSSYESVSNNLTRIFSIREFPIKITLKLQDATTFKSGEFIITPSTLTLKWVIRATLQEVSQELILADFASAEDLTAAINSIIDSSTSVIVFDASLDFLSSSFSSHPSNGSFVDTSSTEIKFSIEDRAWIVGDDGLLLMTTNSGAQWTKRDTGTVIDLKDVSYIDESTGWIVGSDGSILKDGGSSFEEQDTDLSTKIVAKIFPEGNVNSLTADFLVDNIIHPDVKVETSKRVQIQYRIRVVEGVDPNTYPESGLGSPYVFSRGPNATVIEAGSYTFKNLGGETGDYGLWRANCRDTVDGFCFAVPMFFVTRRNLAPFNSQNNINGSANFDLGAIRPDGQLATTVGKEDIIDVRRSVIVNSYKHLLEKNFDKLLNNKLRTKIGRRSEKGTQFGASILVADRYQGVTELESLVAGNVNSGAVFTTNTLDIDASIGVPSQSDLTFPVLSEAIYHGNPAHYSAVYSGFADLEGQPIPGTFEGLGTTQVKFVLGSDATSGGDFTGLRYLITAGFIDFSAKGLSRVPETPIAVRNFDTADPAASVYYRGVDKFAKSTIYQMFNSGIEGVKNFVVLSPFSGSEEQQTVGSLIEYHYFLLVETATNKIRVPKEIDNFVVYGVRKIISSNGSLHKIEKLEDREFIDFTSKKSNLIITINDAFRIPENTIVEIVLEVVSVPLTETLGGSDAKRLGLSSSDSGETLDAFRNSFVANFNPSIKGIDAFYKSVLLPVTAITSPSSISLSLNNAVIVGIASFTELDDSRTSYCWYSPVDEVNDIDTNVNSIFNFRTVLIEEATGFGTASVTIKIDQALSPNALIYVPVLIQETTLSNSGATSGAEVFYKYRAFQTVENLPTSLFVEVLCVSEYIYISNLGTGGGEVGIPYRNPIDHIPVNDNTFFTESLFFNLDPLRFFNFEIGGGFLKLPVIVGRHPGEDLLLSEPKSDRLGRTFYSSTSEDLRFVCEGLKTLSPIEKGSPRKIFIPMLVKIKSSISGTFARGEIVLMVISRVLKDEIDHETGVFDESNSTVSLYRLSNRPLVRN